MKPSLPTSTLCALLAAALSGPAGAATATIDATAERQTIEGFGGGTAYYQNWLTAHPDRAAIYDTLFTGMGLQVLRMGNWNQDTNATLRDDSLVVAEMRRRTGSRARIFLSSWSPPTWLKASGRIDGATNGVNLGRAKNTLAKANGQFRYDDFAKWWRASLEKYARKGVVPTWMSIQNEPDMNADYAACLFDPAQNDTIAGYGPALAAVASRLQGLANRPKLVGPEPLGIGYGNFQKYMRALDKNLLDGYAFHMYHGTQPVEAPWNEKYKYPDGYDANLATLATQYPDKPQFMSELCSMGDLKPTDGLSLARIIHNTLTSGSVSSYIHWDAIWGDGSGVVNVNNPWDKSKWKDAKGWQVGPEYHALRHYARFTAPGWKRVDARSGDSDVRVVAFRNPAGDSLTVVALNIGASARPLSLSIAGFAGKGEVWQTVVSGASSKRLGAWAQGSSVDLPDSSITTLALAVGTTIGTSRRPGESGAPQGLAVRGDRPGILDISLPISRRDAGIEVVAPDGRILARQRVAAGAGSATLRIDAASGVVVVRWSDGTASRHAQIVLR